MPSALQFLVGNELRLAREAASLSLTAAAKALGWAKGTLSYWESGRNQQREGEVRSMLGLYKASAPDIERIVRLAKQPDDNDWWASYSDVVPDWLHTRVGLEALACKEFVYDDKVTFTSNGASCVEVALTDTETALRDTKHRSGGHLTLPAGHGHTFITAVKVGGFRP